MKKKARKLKQGIYILPNLFTSINLFLGFYAIIQVFKAFTSDNPELYKLAALAIIVATVFDTLDGKIARLTKTTSHFGQEYDSLADLSTFGLAPAILLYAWGLSNFGKAGWLAVFLYFACVALRLARFNVQSKSIEKNRFQGLPCPAAAGLIAALVLIKPSFVLETRYDMLYVLFLPYLLAILMVSNIPYRNFKDVDFRKRFSFSIVLTIVVLIIIVAYKPIYTIMIIFTAYFTSGIVETVYRTLRRRKNHLAADEKAATPESKN